MCHICLYLGVEDFLEVLGDSLCHVCLDLGVEGFVEALWGLLCHICLDLGIEGLIEALGGSLYSVCLNLGVEGFIECWGIHRSAIGLMMWSQCYAFHHSKLSSTGKAEWVYDVGEQDRECEDRREQ